MTEEHLSDKRHQELNCLREWCATILKFLPQEEAAIMEIVEQTYSKADLRGMRLIARDLNALDRDEWTSAQREELNRLLKDRFGKNLADVRSRDLTRIDRIRKRGIRTENEFRLVHERAEEIWDDDTKRNELEALNRLLADYQRGVAG